MASLLVLAAGVVHAGGLLVALGGDVELFGLLGESSVSGVCCIWIGLRSDDSTGCEGLDGELRDEWVEDVQKCILGLLDVKTENTDRVKKNSNVYGSLSDGSGDEKEIDANDAMDVVDDMDIVDDNEQDAVHLTEKDIDMFNNTHVCEIQIVHAALWKCRQRLEEALGETENTTES